MNIRSGVAAFDRQWNGTVPAKAGTSPLMSVGNITWDDKSYQALPKPVQYAVDGLMDRGCGNVWVYTVHHTTPRSKQLRLHGYVVADSSRFPWFVIPSNRSKDSAKILEAVKHVVDALAWDELQAALERELKETFVWDVIVEDVLTSPYFDKYDQGDSIVGRTWCATWEALKEVAVPHAEWVRARMEETEEWDLEQYLDEALEDALDAVAEEHGIYAFLEDGDVYFGKTLLSVRDSAKLARHVIVEYDEYKHGYGHAMATPAEQVEVFLSAGSEVTVTHIRSVNDIEVDVDFDESTYEISVSFDDLLLNKDEKDE